MIPGSSSDDRAGTDKSFSVASQLERRFRDVHLVDRGSARGKGAALKLGFEQARGSILCFTDADLPYDLAFVDQAVTAIEGGADFITGNRRLAGSRFRFDVAIWPMLLRRHRAGLGFNRLVRALFAIPTTDSQAGIKALSRRFADHAFPRLLCPGFFFDLELFMIAARGKFRWEERAVNLTQRSGESEVRVLRESIEVFVWLVRLKWAEMKGHYG